MRPGRAPTVPLAPGAGVWRDGDPEGERRWVHLEEPLRLENGSVLPGVRIAYQTWGRPAPARDNAVLVLHALTGDAHIAGEAGPGHPSPGWWDGLVGPGRALDTDRWFVVAPNVLGGCQGTTGPASLAPDGRPWGARFPRATLRDSVRAESALADALGVPAWAAVIGGSMGGMRALEWALTFPGRVERALVLACPAATTGRQIAWAAPQLHAIRSDPNWQGGGYHGSGRTPAAGLGIARRIAHLTYRSDGELDTRFGNLPQDGEDPADGGRYAVESYLDHQADKLVHRFDPAGYVLLTEAMNAHDIGRGRGGTARALRSLPRRTLVGGVDSDRIYPLGFQEEIARGLPVPGPARVISSPHGHDGFLVAVEQVAALVDELLHAP
ncbi:homoserine O-acetyltransferase [Nocardiopsis sp. HNM0947]|uniref:Homoserine O-acetyltransferase n=1 Tax=Nocardiopsis coralli TaxID=2772213 RepID=A0ABR9PE79_9ACTN|nr:homoserine O-acetyltransferase [Nocardiopsis coralli]MBE3002131.1 homoserine O-acetyltransferase [Nocardiopsis coralli]